MDAGRFDDVSRALGRAISRRTAVRRVGAGGLAGAVLTAAGARRAAAHDATPAAVQAKDLPGPAHPVRRGPNQCSFAFFAEVYHGPSAGLELGGDLELTFDPNGRMDGALKTTNGNIPVVGQATGRLLTVLFDLGDGTYISGSGNADSDVRDCAFHTIVGPFVGPYLSDLGAWGPCPCLGRPRCPRPPGCG